MDWIGQLIIILLLLLYCGVMMLVEYMYVSIRSIYSLVFVLLNVVVVYINENDEGV